MSVLLTNAGGRRSVASPCRVVLVPDPAQALTGISLRIGAGSHEDPLGHSGLAHLLEHLTFTGGHAKTVQTMGGFVNAKSSADWTKYFHVVTPDLAPVVLELERRRFTAAVATMTRQAVETEREIVLNERLQRMDNVAYGTAIEQLLAHLYPPGSGYHRLPIGLPGDLARVGPEDCQAFYHNHYAADRVCLAITGNFDPDRTQAAVDDLLGVFPAASEPHAGTEPASAQPTRRIVRSTRFRPKVYLGLLLPPANTWEFELARFATFILARGAMSWLADRLLRATGTAASVELKTLAREHDHSIGVIELVPAAGISADTALAVLDLALAAAGEGAVGEDDLTRAKAVYRASWLADDDSMKGLSDGLSLALQLHGSPAPYRDHDQRIAQLTMSDVLPALRRWHRPGQRVELIYRP